jgi:GntR family transcriptional regulator, transcriptional repressor for pyruvate dehydrogenase complex
VRQLRQPRLAEIVAASLRDDILTGKLKEGDALPRQENLFTQFRVSLPAIREAMRILETEGLISVRRGNVGGAIVHLPTAERTAQMISMVLQTRGATPGDVSGALTHIEPICAGMCAAREDRATEVVPALREVIEDQQADFDDAARYSTNARQFHETMVERCGSETMIVVIGSLERIWSAHESSVWDDAAAPGTAEEDSDSPMARKTRRAALRDHEKILAAIEAGNQERATALAAAHLSATRSTTLASNRHESINANLVGGIEVSGRPAAR